MIREETKRQLRKFLGSQNLYTSVRLTAAALIPSVILYHYHLLASAIALPLGVMFTGFSDSPGPLHHRRNSLAVSIFFNFFISLIAGVLHTYTPLVIIAVIFFGMFFSLIAVYGTRAGSVGLNALIVFIFNIDGHLLATNTALHEALLFAAGGVWYAALSLALYTLRPYKLMQQMLGECVIETAGYLRTKGGFYGETPDYDNLSNQLIQYQVTIRQTQEDLREMLFKTRSIIEESTVKGRVLMSVFLDSIDLMERIMTSQYDYAELHQKFDDTNLLRVIKNQIDRLADELHETGLALQSGFPSKQYQDVDALQEKSMDAFFRLRKTNLTQNTIGDFIALRQILYSLQDITERIKRIRLSTYYDSKISKTYKPDVDLQKFISHNEIEPRLLLNNLTLKSANFRHAARVTLGLLTGYAVSFFFPLGHSYWILLTIAVILKPAYSITKKRNIHRVCGTLTGAVAGFALLYFVHNTTVLFILLVATMIIAYSFLKVNYFISSAGITLYVLMSFSFLSSSGFRHALNDRVIDTLIGSAIAWLVAIFVLPNWEHEQIDNEVEKALVANRNYFNTVAQSFAGEPADITTFKLHRKDAFVALANLSDTFQRMLSDPKNKQIKLTHYHQFVSTSHTLTSYIASLSYYAERTGNKYASEEFNSIIKQINAQFGAATDVLAHHPVKDSEIAPALPVSNRVAELLVKRREELNAGGSESETTTRKTLSDLKTINDQFELISNATVDEVRILEKIIE